VRSVPGSAGAWKVHVHFWYEAGTEGWEDVVLVRKEHDRYVIDDVLLTGAGPFNPAGRLSEVLQVREENWAWRQGAAQQSVEADEAR
jgi:hypothetical protein